MAYITISYRRALARYPAYKARRRAREIDAFQAAARAFDDCAKVQPASHFADAIAAGAVSRDASVRRKPARVRAAAYTGAL